MHITGQFYTPPWLAQLLIGDSGWTPKQTLIDPFCGSGVFLVCALERAKALGYDCLDVLPNICGIDLNPSAYIAARTNIILFAARTGVKDFSKVSINLLCADSLAPAVTEGSKNIKDLLSVYKANLMIDGEVVDIDPSLPEVISHVSSFLEKYGFSSSVWFSSKEQDNTPKKILYADDKERKIVEQLAAFLLVKASCMATNPPWVGWEYMSRSYRNYLNPAWAVYSLFDQKGLEASFLKEDISTLCIASACDRYLSDGGSSVIVLRPATMKSDMTARGLRRLSIFPEQKHLNLKEIREFGDIKVFGNASAPAASWKLIKGEKTTFPIPVKQWNRAEKRRQPTSLDSLEIVSQNILETSLVCNPVDPNNNSSRWSIGSNLISKSRSEILGGNKYEPRIGFFTGGANAIYYMEHLRKINSLCSSYRNITERAKKKVEEVTVTLEDKLIYQVIRGRDLSFWKATPEVKVLCPHTESTKMYPIKQDLLELDYPNTYSYLSNLQKTLEMRNGFAGWEKKIHRDFYYTLQRVGEYTFAPYKVCWSYISSDFVISVIGPDENGKPIFPNDKVVFIPFYNEEAAYFVAGILSSSPLRSAVVSSMSARQVAASVIKHYKIPDFDIGNKDHKKVSDLCKNGHIEMSKGNVDSAAVYHHELDCLCGKIYGYESANMLSFKEALNHHLGYFPFKGLNYSPGREIDKKVA